MTIQEIKKVIAKWNSDCRANRTREYIIPTRQAIAYIEQEQLKFSNENELKDWLEAYHI